MSGKVGKNQPKTAKKPKISAQSPKTPGKTTKSRADSARAYYAANSEHFKERALARYNALTEAERTVRRWKSYARPPTPRPGSRNSKDPRKVALARAFCEWSDLAEVVRIYMACAVMNELGWDVYVVDHLVPLNHPLVCGLHAHPNLVVVTHAHNAAKGNSVWPYMPEITWDTIELLLLSP